MKPSLRSLQVPIRNKNRLSKFSQNLDQSNLAESNSPLPPDYNKKQINTKWLSDSSNEPSSPYTPLLKQIQQLQQIEKSRDPKSANPSCVNPRISAIIQQEKRENEFQAQQQRKEFKNEDRHLNKSEKFDHTISSQKPSLHQNSQLQVQGDIQSIMNRVQTTSRYYSSDDVISNQSHSVQFPQINVNDLDSNQERINDGSLARDINMEPHVQINLEQVPALSRNISISQIQSQNITNQDSGYQNIQQNEVPLRQQQQDITIQQYYVQAQNQQNKEQIQTISSTSVQPQNVVRVIGGMSMGKEQVLKMNKNRSCLPTKQTETTLLANPKHRFLKNRLGMQKMKSTEIQSLDNMLFKSMNQKVDAKRVLTESNSFKIDELTEQKSGSSNHSSSKNTLIIDNSQIGNLQNSESSSLLENYGGSSDSLRHYFNKDEAQLNFSNKQQQPKKLQSNEIMIGNQFHQDSYRIRDTSSGEVIRQELNDSDKLLNDQMEETKEISQQTQQIKHIVNQTNYSRLLSEQPIQQSTIGSNVFFQDTTLQTIIENDQINSE
eukprot:403337714